MENDHFTSEYKSGPAPNPTNTQAVALVCFTRQAEQQVFMWGLSRQTCAAHAGCWMTDSVVRVS